MSGLAVSVGWIHLHGYMDWIRYSEREQLGYPG